MKTEIVSIGIIIFLMTTSVFNSNSAFGHNFKSDESAEFLTFVDKVKSELQLVLSNIEDNDMNLAKKHSIIASDLYWLNFQKEIAEKNNRTAINLRNALSDLRGASFQANSDIHKINTTIADIEDVLAESISVRVNPDHINNSTIQMLHLTNLLNSIDIYYTKGVDTSAPILKNVEYSYNNSEIVNNDKLSRSNYTTTVIKDVTYYQSALELAKHTEKLFDTELSKYLGNDQTKIDYINDNLENLKDSINSKISYVEIYHIISSTQSILNQDFNLALT